MSLASLYNTAFPALRDTDTVADATEQMLRHRVTDLPVVSADGKLMGMFKLERMLAFLLPKAALIGYGMPDLGFVSHDLEDLRQHMRDIEHHPVLRYVVAPQHTADPKTSPLEIVLLLYRGVNNIPVVDRGSGKLLGMISARDLLAALHEGH